MDIVSIQLKSNKNAIYLDLAAQLEKMILTGGVREGEKLPSVRRLAGHLKISNSTVIAAYRHLEDRGLVFTKTGSGTYILPPRTPIERPDIGGDPLSYGGKIVVSTDLIDLAGNTPGAEVFPTNDFKNVINRVLDIDGGNAFTYQESQGYSGLRDELVNYMRDGFSIDCEAGDILITSGAQQAIDLISKVLLQPNDTVFVENPTYRGAQSVFAQRGAKMVGIPVDRDGLNMEMLRYYVKRYSPKLLYTIPVYQTPTGAVLSAEKRLELLYLAEKYGFYILEEDLLSELCLDGDRIFPLKSQDTSNRVIYIKSFSKIFMPGIRTGFILAPKRIAGDIFNAKYVTDISASGLIQRALRLYLQSGAWKTHLENMIGLFGNRMETAYGIASGWEKDGISLDKPKGGFGLWLKLPDAVTDRELYRRCLDGNVLIAPGSDYYVSPVFGSENFIRISYSSAGTDDLKKGLSVIRRNIASLLARNS